MSSEEKSTWSESDFLTYSGQHLLYEVKMFFHTGKNLNLIEAAEKECSPDLDPIIDHNILTKNVFLEAFVIHLRNLILFLYPHSPEPNDVISDDFFSDPIAWKRVRPKISRLLEDARNRSHKEVPHLTSFRYSRVGLDRPWRYVELMKDIKERLQKFVDHADSLRLATSVKNFVGAIDVSSMPSTTDPSTKRL